jgi:hypothetical protein
MLVSSCITPKASKQRKYGPYFSWYLQRRLAAHDGG